VKAFREVVSGRVRWVALFALMLCAISVTPVLAESEEEASSQSAALSAPPEASLGVELKEERTATSKTFELPEGARETRIYASPVNYRDEEGHWQPIEEGFEEVKGSSLINGDNGFDVSLPQQMDEGPVRLASQEGWVASQLIGTPTETVEVSGNTASYEGTQPGVDFDLHTVPNGIKEDIGLAPIQNEDGSIEFRNDDKKRSSCCRHQ
jgi:hypothetical protein